MGYQRLEAAIATVNAELLDSLANGASLADSQALESTLGRSLPEDFCAAWKQHNGHDMVDAGDGSFYTAPLFTGMEILSTRQIASEWKEVQAFSEEQQLEARATGPVQARWWTPDWVPIVLIGGATAFLCIDLDPAPDGERGQIIYASPKDDERKVIASSTTDLLAAIAAAIEEGRAEYDEDQDEIDVLDVLGIYPRGVLAKHHDRRVASATTDNNKARVSSEARIEPSVAPQEVMAIRSTSAQDRLGAWQVGQRFLWSEAEKRFDG